MTRLRKKILYLAAILFAALMALGVCTIVAPENTADAAPTVTTTDGGKVSLGELCERYDVLYAVVPKDYLEAGKVKTTVDKDLRDLQDAGRVTVYNAEDALDVLSVKENGVETKRTLRGWASGFNIGGISKVMLVIPKEITGINTAGDGGFERHIPSNTTILTGVVFEQGSKVTEIPAGLFNKQSNLQFAILSDEITKIGKQAFGAPMLTEIVMPKVQEIGELAFSGDQTSQLTSLYHITIPSTMKTISGNAFTNTTALCDIENNSDNITATQLNTLFPYAMNIYGTSKNVTAGGKSYLYVWENYGTAKSTGSSPEPETLKNNRDVNNSLVFCYNAKRSGVLATTSAGNKSYENKWYFVALDGVEDKEDNFNWSQTTEYHFPAAIDLKAERSKIKWDYLDSDGKKCVNEFKGETSVSEYDINSCACYNKRIRRIFLPESVKVIGDYAFFGSQVGVLDISSSVTHIGQSAFRQSHRFGIQHYYIRHQDLTKLNMGNYVFAAAAEWSTFRPSWGPGAGTPGGNDGGRRFIFSNLNAYNSISDLAGKFNKVGDAKVSYTYLIPVDTYVSGVKTGDTDYRLYQQTYAVTQNADASWTQKQDVGLPVLEGYTKNVWYQASGDIENPVESKIADIDYVNGRLNSKVSEINLYTKKIDAPEFENREYNYADILKLENKYYSLGGALQFTDEDFKNYKVDGPVDYTDFNNSSSKVSNVQNAGTYQLPVILNPQWGVWDTSVHNYSYTVTVTRAEFDLGIIANLPQFTTDSVSLGPDIKGEGVQLIQYSDGWYLYEKTDENSIGSATVLNSYVRHTGETVTISAESSDSNVYSVSADSESSGKDSNSYIANFTLQVSSVNYIFTNTSYQENAEIFNQLGITFTNLTSSTKNATVVNLTKRWYIVLQQNWFIDSEADDGSNDQYSLLTNNGNATTRLPYEANFDDSAYEVHIPKLAIGMSDDIKITFTMSYIYNGITADITNGEKSVKDLPNYVNAAMPAGTYEIIISAPGVTDENGATLPKLSDNIRLTVTPKAIVSGDIVDLLGKSKVNTFEHKYDNSNVYLYDDATATQLQTYLDTLNTNVNTARKNASYDSIWKEARFDGYYENVKISYNLDRMQSASYADNLTSLDRSMVPREVGQYVVYYCLSARNYVTVGGEAATDRRDYAFNTTIYRLLDPSIFNNTDKHYNLTYTGGTLKTSVTYSPYYDTAYPDSEYINVGEHTFTVTLTDTVLNRWDLDKIPANASITKIDGTADPDSQGVLTVTYEITAAKNSWNVAPQLPSWTFNSFDETINKITSSLSFNEINEDSGISSISIVFSLRSRTTGEYVGQNGKPESANNPKLTFTVNNDGTINDTDGVIKILNSLKPDTYYLECAVGDLCAKDDDSIVNVEGFTTSQCDTVIVSKAVNTWTSTPNVIQWAWDSYDPEVNVITAEATYPNLLPNGYTKDDNWQYVEGGNVPKVTYSIYELLADKTKQAITGLQNFTEVDGDIAVILRGLPAGNYVLATSLAQTEYYTAIPESSFDFRIAQAVNTWTTTPNVIRWVWDEYDSGINKITAFAQYGATENSTLYNYGLDGTETAPEVNFTILNSKFETITDLINFTSVTPAVVTALKGLDAGTYYLVASLEGRRNYTAINPNAIGTDVNYQNVQTVPFEIRVAGNSWDTTPRMTTWQYGQFTDSANFIAGIPAHGTTVHYGIYVGSATLPQTDGMPAGVYNFTSTYTKDDDGNIIPQSTISDIKDDLLKLGAGTDYWLVAYVEGAADKYDYLYREINFAVIAATNSWTQTPAIIGWTYLEFGESLVTENDVTRSTLVTEGIAAYGDVLYTVQTLGANSVVTGTVDGAEDITYAELLEVLKDLGVNAVYNAQTKKYDTWGYNLKVTTKYSTDYSNAEGKNIPFTVLRADDSWKVDSEPYIDESWTFGTDADDITVKEGTLQNQTNATVTVEYYKTTTDRNGQLVVDYNKPVTTDEDGLPADVGSYARVTTVAEGINFNELVHVSFFNITKVTNNWNIRPEMSLRWTWGAYKDVLDSSYIIIASAQHPATITYAIYHEDGSEYKTDIPQDDIRGILERLPAGQYSVRTAVAESDNYDVPDPSYLVTTVIVEKADFVVTTAPSSDGWTWGDTDMPFTEMTVEQVIASDLTKTNATIEYSLNGGESWRLAGAMLVDLRGRGEGTYTVDVRVTYTNDKGDKNYNDNTDYSVTVVIRKAEFAWTGDGTSEFGWTWNNTNDATGKTLPALTASTAAKDVSGVTVTYTVKQGASTLKQSIDHDELLAYLYDIERINTYTVTATATTGSATYDANFTTDSKTRTFTVEIEKAENSWKTDPTTEIEFEFVEERNWMTADKLTLGIPAFGQVEYYDSNGKLIVNADGELLKNETLKAELVRLINALDANDKAYSFNIKVTGNNYYEGLEKTLTVTVNGKTSSWKNTDKIQDYNFTYGSDLSSKMADVVIPELKEIPDSASDATLYYSITYVNYKGEESTTTFTMGAGGVTFGNIISRVTGYLTDPSRSAGTYTVTAVYNPHTDNYAQLNTPFTITVKRFELDWTKKLEAQYVFEYETAAGITPVTNAAAAGIDVPVKYLVDGDETDITDLTAYINGQAVKTYEIKYSVDETDNYTGLTPVTMRVIITKAANRWLGEESDRKAVWQFSRGTNIEIIVPEALHGSNTYTVNGSDITTTDFNVYLRNNCSAARDYVITIRVEETDKYYGTEPYTFTLRILKNDNRWLKEPKPSITKVGSLKESDFTIPVAEEANGLLRFDVVKAGGGVLYSGIDETAFKAAIPELTDGTYTITMRVGGENVTGYTDSDATLLNNYNADYNQLLATTVVTVTRAQLEFTTDLAVPDWAYANRYDAKNHVTKAVLGVSGGLSADEKAEIMVGVPVDYYSITGNNVNITGKTYEGFLLELEKLAPGTYSATASIATTLAYIGVSETVVFTVSKNTTDWANASQLINLLTWTYGDDTGALALKTPVLATSDTRTVKYTLRNGSTSTEFTEAWHDKLQTLGAGTYIFTASVDEDEEGINTSAEYVATVTVERATRTWGVHPSKTSIDWTYHAAGNTEIEYEYTAPNNDEKDENGVLKAELIIYVDNVRLVPASGETLAGKLASTLNSLVYGTHSITATVARTIYYEALTETVTLAIARDDNSWSTDMRLKSEWVWDTISEDNLINDLNWRSPVPANGDSVIITVEYSEGSTWHTSFVTTFSYSNNALVGGDASVSGLLYRLRALDAGSYRITAQVPQDDCYNELNVNNADKAIMFTVKKAENSWTTEKPYIDQSNGVLSVRFFPKYGDYRNVEVYYAPKDDPDNWSTTAPVAKGDYLLKGYLDGSANYDPIDDEHNNSPVYTFSLEKENNGWLVLPGVNGWEWNTFDKDVNIFRGTAINNGTVIFRIEYSATSAYKLQPKDFSEGFEEFVKKYGNGETNGQKVIDSILYYHDVYGGFVLDDNGLVSEEVEALLKLLLPKSAQYRLYVTADGDADYESFSIATYFSVTSATNSWTTNPNVDSFVYGGDVSFTAGVTKYSTNVRYQIVNDETDEIAVSYDDFDYAKPVNSFKTLDVGIYVLEVYVPAGATYGNLYDEDTPYPKTFKVTGTVNSWKTDKPAPTSISRYYKDLRDNVTNIRTLFTAPEALEGTPVYKLYTTSYAPVDNNTYTYVKTDNYEGLLTGLKALKPGDYIIRIMLDGDTLKNYGNLTADVSLSIMRYTTEFVDLPASFNGQWKKDGEVNATALTDPTLAITAVFGEADANGVITTQRGTISKESVRYTYGKTTYNSWSELKASSAIKALNAGSYQIVVSIDEDDVYSGVSATVQLDVARGTNSWQTGWTLSGSLTIDGKTAGDSWKYGSTVKWDNAIPKYGKFVYVEIKKDGASEALSYISINYGTTEGLASTLASVGSDLSKLGAGTYVLTVTAPADTNWDVLTVTKKFTIVQAENAWVATNLPHFANVTDNKWTYNPEGTLAVPSATAKYGTDTITYTYYNRGSTTELTTGMPVNAGKYTVVFGIAETKDYSELSASVDFEILKGSNESFIVSHGTTGWTWSSFNRLTNLFKGIPTTRGDVSYTILYNGAVVVVDGIKLENIPLVDSSGVHTGDPDKDLYVPELYKGVRYAELINKLNANDLDDIDDRYVLRINVGEVANYEGFPADSPFAVSPAANEWVVIPGIVSWSIGETVNTPHAQSLYGHPEIIIKSKLNGDVYYSKTYNDKTQDYDIDDKLAIAPAGWYIMETTVEGVKGQFNGLYPDPIEFQVFIIGISEQDRNKWVIDASITDWTATYDINEIVMPVGTPLRGLPYFVFRDSTGKEITADDEVFTIEAGDTYFKDFYIPMLPGTYSMIAYADRYDLSGNIVDHIWSEPVWFEIIRRENSWVNDPRIANVLYLGEKTEWTDPVAAASTLAEKTQLTVLYLYKETGLPVLDKETGLPIRTIPTEVGKYTLFVTAASTLYKTIEYTADFRVEYSYNAWISAPTVESYTEEYGPNTPVAEAVYGTDRIVYTYAPQDNPDDIHEGLPAEEGEYIVFANIDCEDDGYANINARFMLSVGPAYDRDLLIVDIVLGSVGSVLTIVVICLAIKKRRYL